MVGCVKEVPHLKETNTGISFANLIVEVKRSFKNSEGVYETDIFSVTMWRGVAQSCVDLCKEGCLVGIKGRLQSNLFTKEDGSTFYNYEIIAEKVSFLNVNEE